MMDKSMIFSESSKLLKEGSLPCLLKKSCELRVREDGHMSNNH